MTPEEWRQGCYYAVREDYNNNRADPDFKPAGIEKNKRLDAMIRAAIQAFIDDAIPGPSSFVELDAIYHCMRRRGIVDPRDPSNQLNLFEEEDVT